MSLFGGRGEGSDDGGALETEISGWNVSRSRRSRSRS
jgi:hypothetical protein